MIRIAGYLYRHARRFRSEEEGNATIEFIMAVPLLLVLFCSAFETGMLMVRQLMLERGLEMTVRAVRLQTAAKYDVDQLRKMVCDGAAVVPDCLQNVRIEMRRIDPNVGWGGQRPPNNADCRDRNDPASPPEDFANGGEHELMMLRVCALYDPFFPAIGIGKKLDYARDDKYALVSINAFVMEPD